MSALRILALCALSAAVMPASVITSSSSFVGRLDPGYCLATFSATDTTYCSGAITASEVSGPYLGAGFVGNSQPGEPVIFTFGSGINAIGGTFWGSNVNDQPVAASIILTLGDGTTYTIPSTTSRSFVGFVSSKSITSLSVIAAAPSGDGPYVNIDDLYAGHSSSAVPEPASIALAGAGCALLVFLRRRA